MELARCVASGDCFLDTYDVLIPGAVLIVDSENPASLIKDRIEKMSITPELPIYYLHFEDIKLNQDEWINGILDVVQFIKPILVIFDSLSRFHNLTENSVEGMSQISSSLRQISNYEIISYEGNFHPAVLMLHHANKQPIDGLISRGSGEIPAGCDIEYGLTYKGRLREFKSYKTRVEEIESISLMIHEKDSHLVLEVSTVFEILQDIQDAISGKGQISQADMFKLVKDKFKFGEHKARGYIKRGVNLKFWNEIKQGKQKLCYEYIPSEVKENNILLPIEDTQKCLDKS